SMGLNMKKWLFFITFIANSLFSGGQALHVVNLRCGYNVNPLGVDQSRPAFSWEIQAFEKNTIQSAYRILVADDSLLLANDKANVWDSKKITSDKNVQLLYAGQQLQSAKKYYWKVMIWDNKGNHSAFSKTASWQMGLLAKEDWK